MLKLVLDNNDTFSFPDEDIIFINISQNVKINASTSKVHTHRIHMKLRLSDKIRYMDEPCSIVEFTDRIQYNDIRIVDTEYDEILAPWEQVDKPVYGCNAYQKTVIKGNVVEIDIFKPKERNNHAVQK